MDLLVHESSVSLKTIKIAKKYSLGNILNIILANARVNLSLKLHYILEMFHQTFSNNKNLYDPRLFLC